MRPWSLILIAKAVATDCFTSLRIAQRLLGFFISQNEAFKQITYLNLQCKAVVGGLYKAIAYVPYKIQLYKCLSLTWPYSVRGNLLILLSALILCLTENC